jgi:hypothetical protein
MSARPNIAVPSNSHVSGIPAGLVAGGLCVPRRACRFSGISIVLDMRRLLTQRTPAAGTAWRTTGKCIPVLQDSLPDIA